MATLRVPATSRSPVVYVSLTEFKDMSLASIHAASQRMLQVWANAVSQEQCGDTVSLGDVMWGNGNDTSTPLTAEWCATILKLYADEIDTKVNPF